jgi:hypothetical protein
MYETTTNAASNRAALALVLAMVGLTACGGSNQEPAESPEAVPATAPAAEAPTNDASGAPEGEHTMPDGTKMKGHEHGAGSDEHKH